MTLPCSGYTQVIKSYNFITDQNRPVDFYLISQSLVSNVAGGWLKMRPYSYDPFVQADSTKLYQGYTGVDMGKDLVLISTIDAEIKIIPNSIFINTMYENHVNWTDFDSIFIAANEEFKLNVPGLDIYDIYIRAIGSGTGYARILLVGTAIVRP